MQGRSSSRLCFVVSHNETANGEISWGRGYSTDATDVSPPSLCRCHPCEIDLPLSVSGAPSRFTGRILVLLTISRTYYEGIEIWMLNRYGGGCFFVQLKHRSTILAATFTIALFVYQPLRVFRWVPRSWNRTTSIEVPAGCCCATPDDNDQIASSLLDGLHYM
ncbi:hypothetical protein HD806DRAFT_520488 [Xylariaceae sp. AK1471]|nr:hypothetical protein HD806DRAFT_520488 [Xylariaceae sp. AK1471]